MNNFRLSHYLVVSDIIDEEEANPKRLLYSTRSNMTLKMSDTLIQKLQNQEFDNVPFTTLHQLIDMEMLVPNEEDELELILQENDISQKDLSSLGFTIQPGANCQLGCNYCGQIHSKNYMPESMYPQVIQRIRGKIKPQYKTLSVTWYGGEPLMALKQIRGLSPMIQTLVEEYQMDYKSNMITNGLGFKKGIFEEIAQKYKIKQFQITLDGLAEHHDKRRMTKRNENSFDIILKNILEVTNSPVYTQEKCRITIRINIDKTNHVGITPLLQLLASHNLQNKVNIDFAPVTDWGDNGASKDSFTIVDFAEKEIDWMMEAMQLGFRFDLVPKRKYGVCMVVNKDYEVFDAFGNIYSCWELPYTPVYENGEHLIGNLKKPEEKDNMDVPMRDWHNDVREGKSWCKTCKFLPVCGGGCPKLWMESTPACPSFKHNMQDKLVLDYITSNVDIKEVID